MRILIAHNAYQHRGGEDSVVEAEIALLRSHGHDGGNLLFSNDEVAGDVLAGDGAAYDYGLPARRSIWRK